MNESLTAIIVVNYCTADCVERCMESVALLEGAPWRAIVVDNASPDGSGRRLQERLQNAEVVLNAENAGFAAGVNVGLSKARALGARYAWLLNPDTTVERGALKFLLEAAEERPEGAIFGSKILWAASATAERRIWGFGGRCDPTTEQVCMIAHDEPDDGRWAETAEVDYVPGCSLLLRMSCLPEIGLMPEEFFMYYEETSWCTAARQAGYRIFALPQSVVNHHFDQTKLARPFTVYYFNRNDRLFWYRRRSAWGKLRMLARVAFKDLPRVVRALWHAPSGQEELFRAHVRSCVDFLCGRWGRQYLP